MPRGRPTNASRALTPAGGKALPTFARSLRRNPALLDPYAPATGIALLMAKMAMAGDVTVETWRAEARAISLAAAADGEYDTALSGYRDIARSLGITVDAPKAPAPPPANEQHLHLYGDGSAIAGRLAEANDDELIARLRWLESEKAKARARTIEAVAICEGAMPSVLADPTPIDPKVADDIDPLS